MAQVCQEQWASGTERKSASITHDMAHALDEKTRLADHYSNAS